MNHTHIQATRPFSKYWRRHAKLTELYLEANTHIMINAYKSYIIKLSKIIYDSSLYVFTDIIKKYLLIDRTNECESNILKRIEFDMYVENLYHKGSQTKLEVLKEIFMKARDYDMLVVMTNNTDIDNTTARRFDSSCAMGSIVNQFKYINYAPVQLYTLNLTSYYGSQTLAKPLKLMINNVCIASLCANSTTIGNKLCDHPEIKCIDHVNNIHATIRVDDHKYIINGDTDHIQSIDYTIRTYEHNILTKEYQLHIEYQKK